jgi:stage V sporulation protein SpoVS
MTVTSPTVSSGAITGARSGGLTEPFAVRRHHRRPAPARSRHVCRTFNREEIMQALRDWVARYGDLPTTADWEPSRARRAGELWRAERFDRGNWPSISMVRREFGTLSDAVMAAGLRPRRAPSRLRPKLADSEEVLRAIREWRQRYGEVPTMADWEPARARRNGQLWRIARFRRGDWPSARTVRAHFGTFSRAVTEAGFAPRSQGQRQSPRSVRGAVNRELMEERRVSSVTALGPAALARCTREVARARVHGQSADLIAALCELAAVAMKWADHLDDARRKRDTP